MRQPFGSPVSTLCAALQAAFMAFGAFGVTGGRDINAVGASLLGVGALFQLLAALLQTLSANLRRSSPGGRSGHQQAQGGPAHFRSNKLNRVTCAVPLARMTALAGVSEA